MFKGHRILAVVPARSGSKRLPGKNTLLLAGKPLINWTIEAAGSSKYIDKVIVSTDSDKIRQIALKAGAEVPFLRPARISNDQATTLDVVTHALHFLMEGGDNFDICLLLQPTSPLRSSAHIDEAIELYSDVCAKSVISVTNISHPVEWISTLGEAGEMDNFFAGGTTLKRSQDYAERHALNGAIYVFATDMFVIHKTYFFETGSYAYVMNNLDSVDIDTAEDFALAEKLLR